MSADFSPEQFKAEQREALLSLDAVKIRAFGLKYGAHMWPHNDDIFWGAVHKARAFLKTIPPEARAESAAWLKAHDLLPFGWSLEE